jgi:3-hydroxybutyryl-CoA dehydrogenase
MEIRSVGVVGAGQMGTGIAHVMALAGYDVALNDVSADALTAAVALIGRNIDRQVTRGKVTEADKTAAMARIHTTLTIADLGPMDLIIEAAT